MKILLTNDDGITAAGIMAAKEFLSRKHEIFIMAPDEEKSACSNAITVRGELTIKHVGDAAYTVNGYPADCVIIGLSGSIIPDVDLVVSGINHGPNVGDDLVFSGTVAAARTAYVFNKPAIAISINSRSHAPRYLDDAAAFLADFVDEIMGRKTGRKERSRKIAADRATATPFINVNYPDIPRNLVRGVKYTRLGKRIYRDSFTKATFVSGEATLQMGGYIESVETEGSDTTELEKGFITITPLTIDATDYKTLGARARRLPDARN
jgi:5'-nucleotidase